MITYVKGDMFNSPAKIIVNTVNVVGVMGKGVALEFKNRYPEMFETYKELCENKQLDIGNLYLWKKSDKWVLLFPTKKHWKNPSKLEYIEMGLQKFADNWDKFGSNSIAFPKLGCGNGGLEWEAVQPLMEKYLEKIPIQVLVYVDKYNDPIPEHENISEIEKWLAGESDATGFGAFRINLKRFRSKEKKIVLSTDDVFEIKEESQGIICIGDTRMEEFQVCELWNWIRDVGIIIPEELPHEYQSVAKVFLEIMKRMRYISDILVSTDGIHFPNKPNAYQYIAD